MPRARTQSGSVVCAATVSEFATEIQAMPTTTIAGNATQTSGTSTISVLKAACTSVPKRTNWSRPKRARQRGKYSAATIAPPPTHESITVKVAGPPPCSWRATSGSSATSPVACVKNRKMRSITTFRRGDCIVKARPTRIAPTKRSPGSGLVARTERQRRISTIAAAASSAFSTNTAAGLTSEINAPATTGPITRDRFIEMPFNANAAGS